MPATTRDGSPDHQLHGKSSSKPRLVASAIFAVVVLVWAKSTLIDKQAGAVLLNTSHLSVAGTSGPAPACSRRPIVRGYRSSAWEQEWRAAATHDVIEQQGRLCALVTAHPGRMQEWLSGCEQQYTLLAGSQVDSSVPDGEGGGPARRLRAGEVGPAAQQRQLQQLLRENEHVQSNELRLQHGHEQLVDLLSGDVFSHFEWDDPCDSSAVISAPIEPLIGHFRDPRSFQCNPNSRVHIESREYLLFVGMTKTQLERIYPGRRLLMDFGTGVYPSSLGWLLPRYEALGVTFDEIWAWEAVPVNHSTYWQKVPASVQPKLHFYNTPLVANTSSPYHPVHFIKQYVHPGDFLVIKLDVDNAPVELAFMHAIRDDPELLALVGEIHFEQHYKHSDVPFFGTSGKGVGYRDVLDFFHGLRHQGLRLHYWP